MDAFRSIGLKVPYTGDGPFWAVEDGQKMLTPLKCLGVFGKNVFLLSLLSFNPSYLHDQVATGTPYLLWISLQQQICSPVSMSSIAKSTSLAFVYSMTEPAESRAVQNATWEIPCTPRILMPQRMR